MKRFQILLIAAAAFACNACEKHSASELAQIDESKAPAEHEAAKKESAKPADSGPAPKFFPDAK